MSDDQREGTHYRYGPGVYLTEKSPNNGVNKILRNNRDGLTRNPNFIRKIKRYVKIDKKYLPYLKKVAGKRNVWLHEKEIDLHPISFFSGYTESAEEKFHSQPTIAWAQSQGWVVPSNRRSSPNHTLANSEFVDVFSAYDDDDDNKGDHSSPNSWELLEAPVPQRPNYMTSSHSYRDEEDEYRYRHAASISRPSQQQVEQGSGLGTIVAGAAATIAVGAAVYGLFSAFRRKNNS